MPHRPAPTGCRCAERLGHLVEESAGKRFAETHCHHNRTFVHAVARRPFVKLLQRYIMGELLRVFALLLIVLTVLLVFVGVLREAAGEHIRYSCTVDAITPQNNGTGRLDIAFTEAGEAKALSDVDLLR